MTAIENTSSKPCSTDSSSIHFPQHNTINRFISKTLIKVTDDEDALRQFEPYLLGIWRRPTGIILEAMKSRWHTGDLFRCCKQRAPKIPLVVEVIDEVVVGDTLWKFRHLLDNNNAITFDYQSATPLRGSAAKNSRVEFDLQTRTYSAKCIDSGEPTSPAHVLQGVMLYGIVKFHVYWHHEIASVFYVAKHTLPRSHPFRIVFESFGVGSEVLNDIQFLGAFMQEHTTSWFQPFKKTELIKAVGLALEDDVRQVDNRIVDHEVFGPFLVATQAWVEEVFMAMDESEREQAVAFCTMLRGRPSFSSKYESDDMRLFSLIITHHCAVHSYEHIELPVTIEEVAGGVNVDVDGMDAEVKKFIKTARAHFGVNPWLALPKAPFYLSGFRKARPGIKKPLMDATQRWMEASQSQPGNPYFSWNGDPV